MSERRQKGGIDEPRRGLLEFRKHDWPTPWMDWKPSGADAHEAIVNLATHPHRIPSNVKYLLVTAGPVRTDFPGLPSLVDRFHDSAKGFILASIVLHQCIEVVIGVGENVIPLVRIVYSFGGHVTPSAGRARARR